VKSSEAGRDKGGLKILKKIKNKKNF